MTAEQFAVKLSATKTATGWQALCPSHDDRNASLSISEGGDGRVLAHCHAGCSVNAICAAAGVEMSELFPAKTDRPQIAKAYGYTDAAGTLAYQVCRYEPKSFRQRRPDQAKPGGWIWDMKGVQRVLYRLPEVLKAVSEGRTIYIVEGEKDADALHERGLCATTNAGGAGKWDPAYTSTLTGANVVILPDRDTPGQKHGQTVAAVLRGVAASVKIAVLPDVGSCKVKDAADFLQAGGTVDDIRAMVDCASEWPIGWTATSDDNDACIFRPSWENEPPETPALISFCSVPVLHAGEMIGIVALSGTGKTSTTGGIVAAVLSPMCDSLQFSAGEALSVLCVDTEQGHYHDWKDWSKAMKRGDVARGVPCPASIQWECISEMETLAERQEYLWNIFTRAALPQILILDGIADFLADVNSTEETAALIYRLLALAKKHRIGLVVTIHMNPQGGSEKGRGVLGSEIWRKAQAMFAVKRDITDKAVRVLTTDFSLGKVRGAPDQLTAYFRWSDEAGMFVSCAKPEAPAKGKKATENERVLARMNTKIWDYTELRNAIAIELGKSAKTGERRIETLSEIGLIKKLADGRYQAVVPELPEKPERWDQK